MRIVLVLMTFIVCSEVLASGCGSYDKIFFIEETQPAGVSETGYDVLAEGHSFMQIRLKDASDRVLTLILARVENRSGHETDYKLLKYDVRFQDGHGCGPVYRCVTGQFELTIRGRNSQEQRVYQWPALSDAENAYTHVPSRAASLLPPFLMIPLKGSDLPQCEYGDW